MAGQPGPVAAAGRQGRYRRIQVAESAGGLDVDAATASLSGFFGAYSAAAVV
ncbi:MULTISPECIES: hypothetical protein [Streptomyces]|uniref:hypothetical protein n=1 Tax=Streptomyces TaxID=1883 RepID=UPI00240E0380|nr:MULTISPECIES: hypothetical protein [Streptomyces]WFB88454.1 hypothetical protein MMU79_37050 [Streptomyces olivaceus]WGK50897.1 hypothetical protein M6G09_37795 [Streptomyces sp. B146]